MPVPVLCVKCYYGSDAYPLPGPRAYGPPGPRAYGVGRTLVSVTVERVEHTVPVYHCVQPEPYWRMRSFAALHCRSTGGSTFELTAACNLYSSYGR